MYEFSSAAALAVTGVYLVLVRRHDIRCLGVLVVTPVLLTLGLAVTVLYTEAAQLTRPCSRYWLVIHVIAAVVSAGVFTVGRRPDHPVPGPASGPSGAPARAAAVPRCPAADALDRLAYRVHAFAFPLWTFAVIAGAIWAENAWGRYWGWDPKETWAFITWVVYAGLPARPRDRRAGRAAAPPASR